MAPSVLEIESLTKRFGHLIAVDGVSFAAAEGAVVGLIGPNGSGKTTTLNLVNGVDRPDSGTIRVAGRVVTGQPSSTLAAAGISRTFQNPRVFATLTAMENMLVPVLHRRGRRQAWRTRATELLASVGLGAQADFPASQLSGGQQKLLEFARALVTRPLAVLMDEPFAGVHPQLKEVMRARIEDQAAQGTAFVIVSHEIPDLIRLCSETICMAEGRVIAAGAPRMVTSHPEVVRAYLGRGPASRGERG